MRLLLAVLTFSFLIHCSVHAEEHGLNASDNFNSEKEEVIKKATVAIVANENLQSQDISSLGEVYKFCSAQDFQEEKLWSNCSGVLISKNVILTAGHCIQSAQACPEKKFVFDYRTNSDINRIQNDKSSIYSCKKVLYWSKPVSQKQLVDFALIQLDRDVTDRQPISLSKSKLIQPEDIFAYGHPLGLPMKVSVGYISESNAKKNKTQNNSFYAAQLSTHGGLSGGGVYNSKTELIGLLVRGDGNIEKDSFCQRMVTCDKQSCPSGEIQKLDLKIIQKFIR